MKCAIISAMFEEIEPVIQKYHCQVVDNLNQQDIYRFKQNDKEFYFFNSGVGKVNSAITVTEFLNKYQVDLIINIGTSGGVSNKLEISDVVVADKLVFHDVDVTAFGYLPGQIPSDQQYFTITHDQALRDFCTKAFKEYHTGTVATGDQFISDHEKQKHIVDIYDNVYAIEMESASIVKVAQAKDIPVFVFRTISDLAHKDSMIEFREYLDVVCQKFINIVELLLVGDEPIER